MNFGILRLYCGESGKPGYYNLQEVGLAKALALKGYNVYIFFLKTKIKDVIEEKINEHVTIIYLPCFKLFNHGIFKLKRIDRYHIDILQIQSDNQIFATSVIHYCIKHKIKFYNYIGTIYSNSNNILKTVLLILITKINCWYYKKYSVVVKNTSVAKQLEIYNITNIQVIPVGLDFDTIPKVEFPKIYLRELLGLPKDKKIIIFVGRLEEYKRPFRALNIMNELVNKLGKLDYLLVMIGEGTLNDKVKGQIAKYHLEDQIIMIRKVKNSDIHKYYYSSDFFLNLNENEIFGMSILEAMYNRCLVVAQSSPGVNQIIENKQTGFIFENYDKAALLMDSLNNTTISTVIENAHNQVVTEFNWNTIADKFIVNVFQKL